MAIFSDYQSLKFTIEGDGEITRMVSKILFWLYLTNAILLINHEIDSAFWKEWKLFKLPGGVAGFLILHFPILFLILYGLVLVFKQSFFGLIISLILSAGGIFAFCIHTVFIRKGRPEFNTPISRIILTLMLLVSCLQGAVTIYILLG
jgi:hypothetical protein